MSYDRQYREVVSKTVTFYYKQKGKRRSKTETVHIPVDINIHVDTDSFEQSVAGCNDSVQLLTSAVVATEAAQVASIDQNARKVADTIVNGFFGYIRSEIGQQAMELTQKIDAYLLHLRELAKSCIAKQKRMETDYNRISRRYLKIFDDLNHELENRIFELDKPAFVFKNENDQHAVRTTVNDLVNTVTISGLEGGELQARISASAAKKRALDTIRQTHIFLLKQKELDSTITQSMLNEKVAGTRFSPVCFIETIGKRNQIEKNVYQADVLPQANSDEWIQTFQNQSWAFATKEEKDNIRHYFNSEVSKAYTCNDPYDARVREMIVKIFNVNSIKSIF